MSKEKRDNRKKAKQDRKYEKRLAKIQRKKEIYDKKAEIRSVKKSMRRFSSLTTTKVLMAYIFINCSVIEIYAMVAMWAFDDLSALYALISAVVTESISFAIYCAKSYNETKQEELIKLQRDQMNNGQEEDTSCDSDDCFYGFEDEEESDI